MIESQALLNVRREIARHLSACRGVVEDEHTDVGLNLPSDNIAMWIDHVTGNRKRLALSRVEIDACHEGCTQAVVDKIADAFRY